MKSPAIKGRYSHNPYLGLAKLIQSPVLQEHFLTGVPGSWFTEDTQDLRTDDEDLGDSIGDMEGMDFTNEGYLWNGYFSIPFFFFFFFLSGSV